MRHFTLIAFAFLCLSACSNNGPVNMTENACEIPVDCAPGTYCDPFTHLCGWDCQTDAECAPGMYCQIGFGRCLREETAPPPPDASPVLEITAGPMEDLTVLAGTADAELVRFTLTNRSDRMVELSSIPLDLAPLTGFGLGEVLGELKIRNERTRVIVAGPIDLSGALIDTMTTLTDAIAIGPGESVVLAVRADLQASAETEFDLTVGLGNGQLGLGVSFADSGEPVDETRIANDFAIVRHINVLQMGSVPSASGVVSVFMPSSGSSHTIDAGASSEVPIFQITIENGRDEAINVRDLRIRFVSDDTRPWAEDGHPVLDTINIYDGRDGRYLLTTPGASGCGTLGCSFVYDGITLGPGERTTLEVRAHSNAAGRRLLVAVGEGVYVMGDTTDGAIFRQITTTDGISLPTNLVVGNQAGFIYLATR